MSMCEQLCLKLANSRQSSVTLIVCGKSLRVIAETGGDFVAVVRNSRSRQISSSRNRHNCA